MVSLDRGFAPPVVKHYDGRDGSIETLSVQADGKILVGGYFEAVGGWPPSQPGPVLAQREF